MKISLITYILYFIFVNKLPLKRLVPVFFYVFETQLDFYKLKHELTFMLTKATFIWSKIKKKL